MTLQLINYYGDIWQNQSIWKFTSFLKIWLWAFFHLVNLNWWFIPYNLQVSTVVPKSPSRRRNSVITWDPDSQVYINTGLPPTTSPTSPSPLDQFDQFLQMSRKIASPTLKLPRKALEPELILEIPSDTESCSHHSSENLSQQETNSAQVTHKYRSPSISPRKFVPPKPRQGRRASHTGEFISAGRLPVQPVENMTYLFPRRSRLRSLGDIDSQEESYTVRSFALEGHRVVNKGDFVAARSRNNSVEV